MRYMRYIRYSVSFGELDSLCNEHLVRSRAPDGSSSAGAAASQGECNSSGAGKERAGRSSGVSGGTGADAERGLL